MNTVTATTFDGFSEAALNFFRDIVENNEKGWFEEHKPIFKGEVQEPAQAFVVAMGERLQAVSTGIRYDTRLTGSGSIMRIYRDTRFSKDKTPYKTSMGIIWWEGRGKKTEHPAVYFGLDANGGSIHTGMHHFPKPMLTAYREAVAGDQGAELAAIVDELVAAGYKTTGLHYKRVPRGYEQDHPRAELLKHNGLFVSAPALSPADVGSAALVDICLAHVEQMAPLLKWLIALQEHVEGER